mmetsp:Transcript_17211/g.44283  ORF Transcript_17211/g.44283 Transcript_17211/m.44283 type:complete len:611 (+) Transcript_17211:91-1923(+)
MGNNCNSCHGEATAEMKFADAKGAGEVLPAERCMSLAKAVENAGSVQAWNNHQPELATLDRMLNTMCLANTVEEALTEVRSTRQLGCDIWAYAYMQTLRSRNENLYYQVLLAHAEELLPVVYTPTVGEACQKFGKMPMTRKGCYISLADKGKVKDVLLEYAKAELATGPDGTLLCDVVLFSDGGRILGLGDLGAWGMGIPIGKLDLYTVCGGFDPKRTIPVLIDAGCGGPETNTERLVIRDSPLYTGLKQPRIMTKSEAGTNVNTAYYGKDSLIRELIEATASLFGKTCLTQFEDFDSNDAFPLLAEFREENLTYNDDIQGTASVAVAGLFGALRLRNPETKDVIAASKKETFLFYGAGSANIGSMKLLANEVGVPKSQIMCMNSKGIVWKSADGKDGSFRNNEQKEFAVVGQPEYDSKDLVEVIKRTKPTVVVGAAGVDPGCFTEAVVHALLDANAGSRPVMFAMSNPHTQAEITAQNAYNWSKGTLIYGSGTKFGPVQVNGITYEAGQVNNVYIFPGCSYGAVFAGAKKIPDAIFLAAAEAVAQSIDEQDVKLSRVVPRISRVREVSLEVAAAVAWRAKELGLATKPMANSYSEVHAAIAASRWQPMN